MEIKNIRNTVNKFLANGKVEEALDFLSKELHDEDLMDDVVFLRGNFISNKEQFELHTTIDKKEHDIALSKIVLGIQAIVKKLDHQEKRPNKHKHLYKLLLFLLSIGTVALIIFAISRINNDTTSIGGTHENQHNFLGTWEAKVEHQGYLIEHGNKRKYLNSEANWIIEMHPDHTALMKATIDTTGKSKLDWYFNQAENKLRFIQEDETSFEVDIKQNEPDYQKWVAQKKHGIKTEEWVWTLKRSQN